MANRAHHGRRTGWRPVFDGELWRQGFVAAAMAAVSMAILGGAVVLARDTSGHDWYAAAKVTVAGLLIAAGFGEDTPVEYRRANGTVETVSRYGLTVTLEARWAREDILAAAWNGATLGALSGSGGALLCLVLIGRRRGGGRTQQRPAHERAFAQWSEEQERLSLPRERPVSAPDTVAHGAASSSAVRDFASAIAAPGPAASPPGKPDAAVARRGEPAGSTPAGRTRRRRDHGCWV